MKLASLKHGRDGRLAVVSRDLTRAAFADDIAPTLQAALDDWANAAPMLQRLADRVESESILTFRFQERECAAPLPRAFQWADGSVYVNHVALVRRARGADIPESFWKEPLIYQGGSDGLLGARDSIPFFDDSFGLDLEGEVAVVTGDTPMGVTPEDARAGILLVMLVNDVSLRGLIPDELAKGFGFFQSKPASAFSPVAVTPDELGVAWNGAKLSLPLNVSVNGAPLGRANAGVDMIFDFGRLIAHAARTRSLTAGTIIGSGTVSNRSAEGGPGLPVSKGGVGYSCIVEQRMVEILTYGSAQTPYLRPGDVVRIEMLDRDGRPVFGAIEQKVERFTAHA